MRFPRLRMPRVPSVPGFDEHGHLALPLPKGISAKNVRVRVGKGVILVTGGGQTESHEEGPGSVSFQASSGAFSNSFSIPTNVRAAEVKAALGHDSVLHIQLPEQPAKLSPSKRLRSIHIQQDNL